MRNSFGNRSRKTVGAHVTEKYFGQSLGNTQDPDDAKDSTAPQNTTDGGNKIGGKGSISGGSKPTPQARQMTTGTTTGGSRSCYPRLSCSGELWSPWRRPGLGCFPSFDQGRSGLHEP